MSAMSSERFEPIYFRSGMGRSTDQATPTSGSTGTAAMAITVAVLKPQSIVVLVDNISVISI